MSDNVSADANVWEGMRQTNFRWSQYPPTYRSQEMKLLANWIMQGISGTVVGTPGVGRSTLLNFLYYRPDVLFNYLPLPRELVAIIPIDLNILPDGVLVN